MPALKKVETKILINQLNIGYTWKGNKKRYYLLLLG